MPLLPDEELTVQHYNAKAMTQAMVAAHYPLQALLYSVALHRLLGWRLPGWSATRTRPWPGPTGTGWSPPVTCNWPAPSRACSGRPTSWSS
ncbi:DNA helicase/exodeoxyribonuclease V, beta subunit [Mycobacteroides abscessus subsp. abscessus]|nr:DNA helicase/exodeoxyribonuclease V, beta subunit [Mycobacteroides abscessus subsp. abscessus]